MLAVESRFYECRPVICRKSPTFWGFVSRSKKKNNLKIRALCRIIGEHGFSHLLDNLQITYLWYSVCAVRYNMCNFRTFFGMQFVRLSTYIDLDIYQLEFFILDYFEFLLGQKCKQSSTTKRTNQNIQSSHLDNTFHIFQLFVYFSGMETKHPFGMT